MVSASPGQLRLVAGALRELVLTAESSAMRSPESSR